MAFLFLFFHLLLQSLVGFPFLDKDEGLIGIQIDEIGEIPLQLFLVLSLGIFFGRFLLLVQVVMLVVKLLSNLLQLINPEIVNTAKIALTFILVLILLLLCTRCSVKAIEGQAGKFPWRFFLFPLVILQIECMDYEPFDIVQFGVIGHGIQLEEIFIPQIFNHHVTNNESQCLIK